MLESLTIFGQQPASAAGYSLPLGNGTAGTGVDVNQAPIQITDIDGLGPVKANILTDGYSGLPGNYFSGSSVGSRNIVMKVGLNPDWVTQTMESLRLSLYTVLMPQQPVRLLFKSSHLPDVEIEGYVEDFTENMFSKDPEMQVSIICPYPFFKAVDASVQNGVSGSADEIDYEGSIPTGFDLKIGPYASGYAGEIRVEAGYTIPTFPVPTEYSDQLVVTSASLDNTHGFEIITIVGQKDLRPFTNSGVGNSSLRLLEDSSVWLQLSPGENDFEVFTESIPGIPWSITYYALYGGL